VTHLLSPESPTEGPAGARRARTILSGTGLVEIERFRARAASTVPVPGDRAPQPP